MNPGANVYLVGFMGSGKSTVGRVLATRLGVGFADLDERIEGVAGATIAEIFERSGEAAFRDLEAVALMQLGSRGLVVATGGGTPLRSENRSMMLATGVCLWLRVPFAVLLTRVKGLAGRERPLWRDEASLLALHREREPLYAFAHAIVDVGDLAPESAADAVVQRLKEVQTLP